MCCYSSTTFFAFRRQDPRSAPCSAAPRAQWVISQPSPQDKLTVFRARKIQRFLSQPFSVAQVFTGREGKQVPVAETVRGFKEILGGKLDDVPEGNFYMKGAIEEVKQI